MTIARSGVAAAASGLDCPSTTPRCCRVGSISSATAARRNEPRMPETTAKAAVLAGPHKVEVREVPVRGPSPSEVQIAALFSGISAGTEMNVYRGNAPQWQLRRDPSTKLFSRAGTPDWSYPLTYGYANVGRVIDKGHDVSSPSVGEVVFSYTPHQSVVVTPSRKHGGASAGNRPKSGRAQREPEHRS